MSQVWFTSDTHFNHDSMISKGWRPQFSSVEEMNETIIENWNRLVRPTDQVWHLGDYAMGRADVDDLLLLSRLNGIKHLITGNHDSVWPGNRNAHKHQAAWIRCGWESVQSFARRKIGGRHVMLSHFPYVGDHTEGDRYDEYRLNDKGLWLIHGHVHEEWAMRSRQINVGVDVRGFMPVSLEMLTRMIERGEEDGL